MKTFKEILGAIAIVAGMMAFLLFAQNDLLATGYWVAEANAVICVINVALLVVLDGITENRRNAL